MSIECPKCGKNNCEVKPGRASCPDCNYAWKTVLPSEAEPVSYTSEDTSDKPKKKKSKKKRYDKKD